MKSFYKKFKYRYYRPSSNPFITGDTFRNFADHIHDDLNDINPTLVKKGDFIFIKSEFIEDFFQNFAKTIESEFFIISHNSDRLIDTDLQKLDHPNLIMWFAQNLSEVKNKKMNFIPIGLENKMYRKNGKVKRFLNADTEKGDSNLVFSCFREYSNNERSNINKIISKVEYINRYDHLKNETYISKLAKSKFNICPEGNGIDSHRIWESLILKSIPIVKRNKFIDMLSSNDVPLFVLDNFDDLRNLEETKLNEFYEEKKYNLNSLEIYRSDYWENKFFNLKNRYLIK